MTPSRIFRLALLPLLAGLALASAPASAGMVYGPFLIWINLAGDSSAEAAIHDYTHLVPTADMCWNSHSLLIAGNLPDGLTPALVKKAVIQRDAAARRRLLAILKRGDGDLEAFDGVVVVAKGSTPTLVSLAASGRIHSRSAVDASGKLDWPGAFCAVMPPISRKP